MDFDSKIADFSSEKIAAVKSSITQALGEKGLTIDSRITDSAEYSLLALSEGDIRTLIKYTQNVNTCISEVLKDLE